MLNRFMINQYLTEILSKNLKYMLPAQCSCAKRYLRYMLLQQDGCALP